MSNCIEEEIDSRPESISCTKKGANLFQRLSTETHTGCWGSVIDTYQTNASEKVPYSYTWVTVAWEKASPKYDWDLTCEEWQEGEVSAKDSYWGWQSKETCRT